MWPDGPLTLLTFALSGICLVTGTAVYFGGSANQVVVVVLAVALLVGLTFLGFFLVFGGGSLVVRFLITLLAACSPFLVPLMDDPPAGLPAAGVGLMLATPVLSSGFVWMLVRLFGRRLVRQDAWAKTLITPTLTTRGIFELTAVVAVLFALVAVLGAHAAEPRGAGGPPRARLHAEIFLAVLPATAVMVLAFGGLTVPAFHARLLLPQSQRSWVVAAVLAGITLLIHLGVATLLLAMPAEILAWLIACELATLAASLLTADLLVRFTSYRLLRPAGWRPAPTAAQRDDSAGDRHPLDR